MRVVVAMSGGVDSSAAAALLLDQGHEVLGITLRVWSYEGKARCGSCCSPSDIDDARAVADHLGIPFYVADAQEIFRDRVVNPFVQSYLGGQTPIPCVACNRDVKFDFLLKRARALGATLATGHYAQVEKTDAGFTLRRAADVSKDQSYFLFTLGQDELRDVCFPVGGMTKAEVRAYADRRGLPTSRKPESMEICFVPDGDYAGFVERIAGPQTGGEVVASSGEVLGTHAGIHRFTVGQRKGLGVQSDVPLYVQRIDPETRRVTVGPAGQGARQEFHVRDARWVLGAPANEDTVQVRVRHRHAGTAARVEVEAGSDRGAGSVKVSLLAPVSGVTPGQAAVFYSDDRVLGGGVDSMKNLWAPWRMEFIQAGQTDGCIFCQFPAEEGEEADRRNLILGRTPHSFSILNRYPYNNGHLMVIPRRHTADFTTLTAPELEDLHRLLQLSLAIIGEAYQPQGFNLGMNLGRAAGAGIADHLHYHVVPRWGGDTNFMPVLADTKVMIEHLGDSFVRLRALYDRTLRAGI